MTSTSQQPHTFLPKRRVSFRQRDDAQDRQRRLHLLLDIWRCIPTATDKVHKATNEQLLRMFIELIYLFDKIELQTDEHDPGLGYLWTTYGAHGLPWEEPYNTINGRAWAKTLIRLALQLPEFLDWRYLFAGQNFRDEEGVLGYLPSDRPPETDKEVVEMVKAKVKRVVYDECDWGDALDGIFEEASSRGYGPSLF